MPFLKIRLPSYSSWNSTQNSLSLNSILHRKPTIPTPKPTLACGHHRKSRKNRRNLNFISTSSTGTPHHLAKGNPLVHLMAMTRLPGHEACALGDNGTRGARCRCRLTNRNSSGGLNSWNSLTSLGNGGRSIGSRRAAILLHLHTQSLGYNFEGSPGLAEEVRRLS